MTAAGQYRRLAAQLSAKARKEKSPDADWNHLAKSYLRLAQQAERNARTDFSYEPVVR